MYLSDKQVVHLDAVEERNLRRRDLLSCLSVDRILNPSVHEETNVLHHDQVWIRWNTFLLLMKINRKTLFICEKSQLFENVNVMILFRDKLHSNRDIKIM